MYLFLKDFIEALSTQLQSICTGFGGNNNDFTVGIAMAHIHMSHKLDKYDVGYLFEGLGAP